MRVKLCVKDFMNNISKWEKNSRVQPTVNVNKASAAELETVKGIGPMLAERIVTYRETHGRFDHLEDLVQVPGIGQAKLERIKSQLAL